MWPPVLPKALDLKAGAPLKPHDEKLLPASTQRPQALAWAGRTDMAGEGLDHANDIVEGGGHFLVKAYT